MCEYNWTFVFGQWKVTLSDGAGLTKVDGVISKSDRHFEVID